MCHNAQRYKARLQFSGDQVCIAGLGSGSEFGTFPGSWTVGMMTNTPGWIKIIDQPKDNETPILGKHYEFLEPPDWKPKQVTFISECGEELRGVQHDTPASCGASWIRVSNYVLEIECSDLPAADVSAVLTPPTPPPRFR